METAGLMNTFPCVVIRGISDYVAAAACAKELPEHVQPRALDRERTAKDILSKG
jgi:nucleoside phosphorylase